MKIPEIIAQANNLTINDLVWKPYHPNNMKSNPHKGYFCTILHKTDSGVYSGRKYSIIFQMKENEDFISSDEIELYILYEKCYPEIEGPIEHPELSDNISWNDNNTLNAAITGGIYLIDSYIKHLIFLINNERRSQIVDCPSFPFPVFSGQFLNLMPHQIHL